MKYFGILAIGLTCWMHRLPGQTPDAVLRSNCFTCHNQQNRTSGLALDNRADILSGGARGPAAKPGSPAESLLIQAIEQKGNLKMPPGKRLPDEQIATLRTWIEQGMTWPEEEKPRSKRGWDHWAFQPIKRSVAPAVKNAAWVKNPIDKFILARLEREGVRP